MVGSVLRLPRSWRPRKVQCPRSTSQMRPCKSFTLKAYSRALLRRQKPHIRGRTSMLHTIELITETLRPFPHRRPQGCQHKMVGARCFFLSVPSGENGRQSAIMHVVGSRGPQTTRHDLFLGHLFEEKAPRESHRETTPQKVHLRVVVQ